MAEVLLATLIFLPVVIAYFLKSNAAVSFLAFCGGFAVITLSGSDIEHLIGKTKITNLTSNNVDIALLALPLLLSLIFTFGSVTKKNWRLLHLIPALCAGGVLALIAGPMFGSSLNTDFSGLQTWKDLRNAQSYIIGGGLLVSLLLVWFGGFTHTKGHSKTHK
ncbi:MAG TPA: hypothetical protein VFW90_04100 [Candidatus Saccharimonadales bacterium]|nr:hypothetical protein [Candidatus Saccharimonadales bacterium]